MQIDTETERLIIVSDLHLGSPASSAAQHFPDFVDGLRGTGWDLCINGDAFDLLQGTKRGLLREGLDAIRALDRLRASGATIHYVLGNHDLPLEHLMADLPVPVVPFLNVTSGEARIRVEHGHVHEPTYVRWPALYHAGGRLGGYLLAAQADVYEWWARAQRSTDRRRRRRSIDDYPYYAAARSLFARGFDTVVFGHTHLPEVREFPGGTFVNAGDWLRRPTHVRIDRGQVTLVT